MKILVIRFSSLGDVILTTPLVKELRKNFPEAIIDFCTKEEFSDVYQDNPNINECISVQKPFNFKKLRSLKKEINFRKYDIIIDAHNNLRTFYLKFFLKLKSKVYTFKKYTFRKTLLVKFRINTMKNFPSVSVRYIDAVKKLGRDIKQRYIRPEIYSNISSREKIDRIFTELNISNNKKIICIIPSSKHFTKTYPAEYYIKLINYFDKEKFNFILIGKDNDKNLIEFIWEQTGNNVINLYNRLNIKELYELMRRCHFVIGGDTGPIHIAEAASTPLIMVAGSSVKEFGFFPEGKNVLIAENNEMKCRPCSYIGKNICPEKHFKCMMSLSPELIFPIVQEHLI